MTLKAALRRILLFPIAPRWMVWGLGLLRMVGLIPKRIQGRWPPQRILIVNLTSYLGDTLMTLPLVDALHQAAPTAEIDFVIEPPMDRVLRTLSVLRRVCGFSPRKTRVPVLGNYLRVAAMVRFARHQFMGERYDLALLPRWGTDPSLSQYLAAMSSAPRVCGFDPAVETAAEQTFPEMRRMLTLASAGGEGMAEGTRQKLLLVDCGLIDRFDPSVEERRTVESAAALGAGVDLDLLLGRLGLPQDRPLILLAPGASHPSRRWPLERFASAGLELSRRTGAAVCSIGGSGDRVLGARLESISHGVVRDLAGQTSVQETVALVGRASLLVTNDSGPAHVGGSVGTPTLVLSACPKTSVQEHPNSPRRVRPVGPKVVVLQPDVPSEGCGERCTAATAHCINGIAVDAVERFGRRMLEAFPRSAGG